MKGDKMIGIINKRYEQTKNQIFLFHSKPPYTKWVISNNLTDLPCIGGHSRPSTIDLLNGKHNRLIIVSYNPSKDPKDQGRQRYCYIKSTDSGKTWGQSVLLPFRRGKIGMDVKDVLLSDIKYDTMRDTYLWTYYSLDMYKWDNIALRWQTNPEYNFHSMMSWTGQHYYFTVANFQEVYMAFASLPQDMKQHNWTAVGMVASYVNNPPLIVSSVINASDVYVQLSPRYGWVYAANQPIITVNKKDFPETFFFNTSVITREQPYYGLCSQIPSNSKQIAFMVIGNATSISYDGYKWIDTANPWTNNYSGNDITECHLSGNNLFIVTRYTDWAHPVNANIFLSQNNGKDWKLVWNATSYLLNY